MSASKSRIRADVGSDAASGWRDTREQSASQGSSGCDRAKVEHGSPHDGYVMVGRCGRSAGYLRYLADFFDLNMQVNFDQ